METLLNWLNPLAWLALIQDHPLISLVVGAPLAGLLVWRLIKGGVGVRRAVINVVGIGLVVWGATSFSNWVKPSLNPSDLFTSPVVGPQAVDVAYATRKTIEKTATYTGTVHPYAHVIVEARTEGWVKTVSVYPGDHVSADQVVATLDTSQLVPKLEEAEAKLRDLQAELKRDEELFRSKVIGGSQLDLSRAKEQMAAATVDLLKTDIGYARVVAPTDGWVSKRAVYPGQYVQPGQHILAYDQLAKVRIQFPVAVDDLASIKVGTDVILEFPEFGADRLKGTPWETRRADGFTDAAIRAKVTAVFPANDPQSQLGTVEAMVDNPDLLLKANTYVVGHFVTDRVENAWVVPESALTPMPGGKTVIFVGPPFSDQGQAEMRDVQVGLRNGKEAQILEGLSEPAYVVVAGNRSLVNDQTVDVLKREGGPS